MSDWRCVRLIYQRLLTCGEGARSSREEGTRCGGVKSILSCVGEGAINSSSGI
jgi:hypothetical protein